MAFDGITTACLALELADKLTGGRIYKIAQTERDELILTIKPTAERGGGQVRLALSASATLPLAYLTGKTKPAPLQAPAFCMLLRKHLQNGRIISVTQPGLERILRFEVEHMNEMGDLCRHTLVIELMGKHSNIILLKPKEGQNTAADTDMHSALVTDAASSCEEVVDSIKHIPSMISSVREVLPGRPYFVPETRGKRSPLEEPKEAFTSAMRSQQAAPAKLLVGTYTGLSTEIAEEICFRADLENDRSASSMSERDLDSLWKAFSSLMEDVRAGRFAPAIYYQTAHGTPKGFSAVPMHMYSDYAHTEFSSVSELLETFYAQKNDAARIRQKSADLRRIVQTLLERDVHKYDLQCKQIRDTEKREKYRIYGELLNAYGYSIPDGAKSCEVDNYYTGEKMRIPLDPTMTAAQNAVRYFDRYTKLKRTNEALTTLTAEVRSEIDHLESIRVALDLSTTEGDLQQIRQELEDSGLVRRHGKSGRYAGGSAKDGAKGSAKGGRGKGKARTPASEPLHYISSDGYNIYVGKNNTQNDALTFHFSDPNDIWFHANDMPGSHVILRTGGKSMEEIPDRAFEEAASLAAWYSAGREQKKVEIDYLLRRNVKKPGGAKPGFVVYYTNYSILAKADISALQEV